MPLLRPHVDDITTEYMRHITYAVTTVDRKGCTNMMGWIANRKRL